MEKVPGVFIELINMPDSVADKWAEWYDNTYLKARTKIPGVVAGRRAKGVVGSIQNIVVYDLTDFVIPYSREWQEADAAVAADSPPPAPVADALGAMEQWVYRQIFTIVEGDYEPENTEILHGAFFEVPSRDQDEFNDWYNSEHVEFVKTVEGYRNCRRFQALEEPTKFCALYDVVSVAHSDAKNVAAQNYTPWANRVRAKLPTYRERRLFHIEQRERGQQ
jgi:hypothetical protein